MNRTRIHIERLVLDGLRFSPSDVGALRAALETTLVGAFAGDGRVETAADRPQGPAALGREAALAIHRSVQR